MTHWSEFGLHNRPPLSARSRVPEAPPGLRPSIEARTKLLEEPLEGIRSGDRLRSGLFGLEATGVSTRPIHDAADADGSATNWTFR